MTVELEFDYANAFRLIVALTKFNDRKNRQMIQISKSEQEMEERIQTKLEQMVKYENIVENAQIRIATHVSREKARITSIVKAAIDSLKNQEHDMYKCLDQWVCVSLSLAHEVSSLISRSDSVRFDM